MCATEENPSVARKQVCRRTLGITKAEKPQSPKSKFKSVTLKKSFFLFSTSHLPRAINKIAGQQWVRLKNCRKRLVAQFRRRHMPSLPRFSNRQHSRITLNRTRSP